MSAALDVLRELYAGEQWRSPFHVLQGVQRTRDGTDVGVASRQVGTTRARLQTLVDADDPIETLFGVAEDGVNETHKTAAKRGLAQLLLGRAAEIAFEDIYRSEMGNQEFELVDLREGRSDTDYRLLNGRKRPIYRLNIKFFGSTFRRAPELVGLDPGDCFPLATYKIFNALKKQDQEHLPYIFLIVGVPALNVDAIGSFIAQRYIDFLGLLRQSEKRGLPKRDAEDRAVHQMVENRSEAFQLAYDAIRSAAWYVLSARKADILLRTLLFDRVYALKIRGFAQQFRGAELDMHFSLSKDLVPLHQFLDVLRDEGQTMVASMMERGTI